MRFGNWRRSEAVRLDQHIGLHVEQFHNNGIGAATVGGKNDTDLWTGGSGQVVSRMKTATSAETNGIFLFTMDYRFEGVTTVGSDDSR